VIATLQALNGKGGPMKQGNAAVPGAAVTFARYRSTSAIKPRTTTADATRSTLMQYAG
jgi:hypothetical protein